MKVKIVATGEIKEVLKRQSYPLKYIDKEGNIYTCEEAERVNDDVIDWERRRYEIARDCLAAMSVNLVNSDSKSRMNFEAHRRMAFNAVIFADKLIEKLKGE